MRHGPITRLYCLEALYGTDGRVQTLARRLGQRSCRQVSQGHTWAVVVLERPQLQRRNIWDRGNSTQGGDTQQFIEDQIKLGEEGLDERDHYLLEVNLDDLESTTGEEQHYHCLIQIQAARRECALREANQKSDGQDSNESGRA